MFNNTLSVRRLQPAPGYLLVEPAKQEKQTSSGLYLPETHTEKPQYGTVLAAGGKLINDRGVEVNSPPRQGIELFIRNGVAMKSRLATLNTSSSNFDDILAIVK